MIYMLDTNICIYYINKKAPQLIKKIHDCLNDGICISTLTIAELEYGVAKSAFPQKNADELRRFLSIFDILEFDGDAAICYGRIRANLERKGTPISSMDTLIAAHALARGQILVTNNIREFERVEGLRLENWVEI